MRIKTQDRIALILQADRAIEKLNSEKNQVKPHWSTMSTEENIASIEVELAELKLAHITGGDVETEAMDIVNYCLFLLDNSKSSSNLHIEHKRITNT